MPRRPPKKWMRDCTRGVARRSDVADPGAVCGSLWYHNMGRGSKGAALSRERGVRAMARRVEGLGQKAAAAHARVGYFLPGTAFEVRTPTLDPGERRRLAEKIVKYGDDPYVSIAGIRIKVVPSPKSYEGGALYVAITEALGYLTWKYDARHSVFTVD